MIWLILEMWTLLACAAGLGAAFAALILRPWAKAKSVSMAERASWEREKRRLEQALADALHKAHDAGRACGRDPELAAALRGEIEAVRRELARSAHAAADLRAQTADFAAEFEDVHDLDADDAPADPFAEDDPPQTENGLSKPPN